MTSTPWEAACGDGRLVATLLRCLVAGSAITEYFGEPLTEYGVTRSGLRYLLSSPVPSGSDLDTELSGRVFQGAALLIWDMEESHGSGRGPRHYSGAVGTIELDDFIQEFDTWCDMQMLRNAELFSPFLAWKGLFQHLEGPPMDDYHEFRKAHDMEIMAWKDYWSPKYVSMTYGGVVGTAAPEGSLPPAFNPIEEFFEVLKKNYQGVRTEKLKSLQEFQRKTGESLREAHARMRRLISVTQGVTEAQAVQFWYGILEKDLRRRVRDATLLADETPKLATVFALSERIEQKLVEKKPRSSGGATSSSGGGGGGRTVQARPYGGAGVERAPRAVPSYSGQPEGPSCWTYGGDHMRRDCPKQSSGGGGGGVGVRSAPFTCGHCGRTGHGKDRCFDLHPELRSERSHGRPQGGRAGSGPAEGRGATVAAPLSDTTATMAARIEELEQRIASMAVARPRSSSGAGASTSYGGGDHEDYTFMASVAQVEASAAVTRSSIRSVVEPRGASVELDPQRGDTSRQARLPQSFT
ncbi:unnamed protein product [Calypogeia fissa]